MVGFGWYFFDYQWEGIKIQVDDSVLDHFPFWNMAIGQYIAARV
jgi:hypothetical protein